MNSELTLPQRAMILHDIVSQFIADNKITCAETIYQTDRIQENSLVLIEQLAEVVGYVDFGDEE